MNEWICLLLLLTRLCSGQEPDSSPNVTENEDYEDLSSITDSDSGSGTTPTLENEFTDDFTTSLSVDYESSPDGSEYVEITTSPTEVQTLTIILDVSRNDNWTEDSSGFNSTDVYINVDLETDDDFFKQFKVNFKKYSTYYYIGGGVFLFIILTVGYYVFSGSRNRPIIESRIIEPSPLLKRSRGLSTRGDIVIFHQNERLHEIAESSESIGDIYDPTAIPVRVPLKSFNRNTKHKYERDSSFQ